MLIELLQDTNVWVLLSFVLFVALVWKAGKKAVLSKLDARIESVRRDIETAESLRVEAQELLAQFQRKQREAAKEAESIVAHARLQAEEVRRTMEKDLDEAASRREQMLRDRLRRMEENAIADIRNYASELAVKATAEIIAANMDEKVNARLVDESIKNITARAG